jgi:type IV secretory pathway VirB3-like protein
MSIQFFSPSLRSRAAGEAINIFLRRAVCGVRYAVCGMRYAVAEMMFFLASAPLSLCAVAPLCLSSSILHYKDMTIFIVTQIFCNKNDYFYSRLC